MLVAPTSAIASSTIRSSSSSDERLGHELLEHLELAPPPSPPAPRGRRRERLDRLEPPLALALEHLQLLVVAERPLQLLLRRPQAGQDQPQRVAALGVPLLHRGGQLRLQLRDQSSCRHPVEAAAEDVPVQVEDGLPGARRRRRSSAGTRRGRPPSPSRRRTRASASTRPAESSPMSRNVSRCRSGMTSTWTSAFGLMSSIAMKPSARLTTVAGSSPRDDPAEDAVRVAHAARIPSSVTARAAHADELADRRVDEPRRVVVAVAPAGPVDEHDVLGADLLAPAAQARVVRERAQPGAALLLHRASGPGRRRRCACPAAASTGRRAPSSRPTPRRRGACSRTRARPRPGSRRSRRSSG